MGVNWLEGVVLSERAGSSPVVGTNIFSLGNSLFFTKETFYFREYSF